jgi:hypothetical protein
MFITAKTLKDKAALAKRTSTSIEELSKRCDEFTAEDRKILQKAADLLAIVGQKTKMEAARRKREEDAFTKALNVAEAEAKKLIATWPAETIVDKTALIFANRGMNNFINYMKEKDEKEIVWYLDTMLNNAIQEIARDAGYQAASKKLPVAEVMMAAREKLETYRTSRNVVEWAGRWEEKIKGEVKTS